MDEEHIDVRKQAIDQMDLVYAGASKGLVLDSELQQINVAKKEILVPRHGLTESSGFLKALEAPNERSLLLIAAHIFRSHWMSRAWTLQEGFLARDCVLQLRDGTVEIRYLDSQAYVRTVMSPLYVGISPWLYPSVSIYTKIRYLFFRPSYVTESNLILRVIDSTHAIIFYILFAFCIVLPVSQWGISTLLSLAALKRWKSTFQTGRAFKKGHSARGLLHRSIFEWHKVWLK